MNVMRVGLLDISRPATDYRIPIRGLVYLLLDHIPDSAVCYAKYSSKNLRMGLFIM